MAQPAKTRQVDSDPAGSDAVELHGVLDFEVFYQREITALIAFAHALSGSRALAEDLAQEAMLATYRKWNDVSTLNHPEAWVRRVCANLSVSAFRRTMVEVRTLRKLGGMRNEGPATDPDEDDAFWASVRTLPNRQAQAVALFYMFDLTVADVALTMGCSEGSVKVHLQRARAALAERLSEGELQ